MKKKNSMEKRVAILWQLLFHDDKKFFAHGMFLCQEFLCYRGGKKNNLAIIFSKRIVKRASST
jgi:hypothetical protein